ncbi:MAG: alkaline phosphatase family protein [Spirochaetes bacterium]|nr:alkaline phosphatase family protein [Spirochaetota bacterium]
MNIKMLILAALIIASQLSGAFKTKHVIILVMDGARWTETWGESNKAYMPRITSDIAPEGAVLTEFRNAGYTETTAGHTALCTGTHQIINNSGKELPANPSIFHYLRKQYELPKTDVWVITSKDKLHVLSETTTPGWETYNPSIDCGKNGTGSGGYRDDARTFSNTCSVLTNNYPAAMIVNFKDPDSYGHGKKWDGYLGAIAAYDRYAAALWDVIRNDEKLRDSTTVFIVNDHGRHIDGVKDGYFSHGCTCDGCRHILCIAIGPDIRRGVTSDVPRNQTDVTATAAYLLSVAMPTGTGTVMKEILAEEP